MRFIRKLADAYNTNVLRESAVPARKLHAALMRGSTDYHPYMARLCLGEPAESIVTDILELP